MNYRIIHSPTQGTMDILYRRMAPDKDFQQQRFDAIGLIQGRLLDMLYAADIAEKSGSVVVRDIRGSCPQNMIVLGLFGDTASVESSLSAIRKALNTKERQGEETW